MSVLIYLLTMISDGGRSRMALQLELLAVRHLYPARTHDERQWSCGYRLETILVVQSAEDWRRDDPMTITNLMAA